MPTHLLLVAVEPCGPFDAGDVIAVCPGDHEFSPAEKENPKWRILRAEMPDAQARALLSGEIPTSYTAKAFDRPRARGFSLDLPALGVGIRGKRKDPDNWVFSSAAVLDATRLKEPR